MDALSNRQEWHPLSPFVPLRTDEPEGQPARIVIGVHSIFGGPDTQRPFSAGFPPTSGLHDNSHDHTNRLP